jgi:hypothetical protein
VTFSKHCPVVHKSSFSKSVLRPPPFVCLFVVCNSRYDVDGRCDFQQTTLRHSTCGQSSAAPHTPPWLPPQQCQPTSHRLMLTLVLLVDHLTPDLLLLLAGLRSHRLARPCHHCSRRIHTNSKPPSNLEALVPAILEYLWVEAPTRQAQVQDNMLARTGRMCLRRRRAWRQPRGLRRSTQITNSTPFEDNRKQKDSI